MNTNLDNLSADALRRAADVTDQIAELQAELAQILSGKKKPGRKPGAKKPGRKPGAKKPGRKPGAKKPGGKPAAKKKVAKKKGTRKISAAARKKMSDKRKAYWAAKRKEKAAK